MSSSEIDFKALEKKLRNKYRFYVIDPDGGGINYSMWVVDGEYEYPVLNSNTGGFMTINSRFDDHGEDHLEITDKFLQLLWMTFHEAMSFTPTEYFEEDMFSETVETVYENADEAPDHELWFAHKLIEMFIFGVTTDEIAPELELLAEWCNEHTEFGLPVLQ